MAGTPEDFQDAFDRIEAAVDAGETDARALGFWPLVRRVKADARLSAHWAETVGRIDRKLFEARVGLRFPVWFGNAVLLVGTAILLATALASGLSASGWYSASGTTEGLRTSGGLLLLVSAIGLSATVHDLAHWVVGRLVGIRFSSYFLDGPTRVQPGLKTDYATYVRTPPTARAVMHAAGAVASKLAPLVALLIAMIPVEFEPSEFPAWAVWGVVGFAALQLITDATFSTKRSDWKRVRRELMVARAQEARKR